MAPAERREQLMTAALHVFARDGLGFARHAAIADRAGVALATVFHYFPTRRKLVGAVLAEVARFLIEDVIRPVHGGQPPSPEAVLALLMRFADAFDRHPDHVRIWLEWSTAFRDEIWASYLTFYEGAIGLIADIVRGGIEAGSIHAALEPADVARVVAGMAHPIAHLRLSGSSRETIEHMMVSLIGQYLRPDPRLAVPARAN